jgi:hypothetical protein
LEQEFLGMFHVDCEKMKENIIIILGIFKFTKFVNVEVIHLTL